MVQLKTLLKRYGLVTIKVPPESFEVFRDRTRGMQDVACNTMYSLEHLARCVEQYGAMCYFQGVNDGVQAAVMTPQLVEFVKQENDNAIVRSSDSGKADQEGN